ncbi:hypothetical protein Pcinc_004956 [Petrolisthes cinctipes]|uniref:Uncharacterized protein n=1 Tax=Petrolisthes cinctipes TaxID=88211 RepID=A0AAE1GG42_PETCI|nr:hypothetical protein Pcinc_004956 [Petrolisthes cinctipes]
MTASSIQSATRTFAEARLAIRSAAARDRSGPAHRGVIRAEPLAPPPRRPMVPARHPKPTNLTNSSPFCTIGERVTPSTSTSKPSVEARCQSDSAPSPKDGTIITSLSTLVNDHYLKPLRNRCIVNNVWMPPKQFPPVRIVLENLQTNPFLARHPRLTYATPTVLYRFKVAAFDGTL